MMQKSKKLERLLQGLQKKDVFGSDSVDIVGVTDDTRRLKKGFLFVAVKGLKRDGHSFIGSAIQKGAVAAVGEKSPEKNWIKATYIKVADSKESLGEIAKNWYDNPSERLKVVGVTGTKGKTTTVHLIYHILTKLGEKVGLVSSLVSKVGKRQLDTGLHVTTPGVLEINKLLSEMVEKGCKYAVLEVSSHGVVQGRVAGISFEVGALTNVAPEHLDYHKSLAEYKKIKLDFINSARKKVVSKKDTKLAVLPGKFNNLNAQLAVDVAVLLGFDREKAVKTLSLFKLPKGRLETVDNNLGVEVVIDFAHTPDSLEAALSHLKKSSKGRLIAVFGSAGERDSQKRPKMGKVASKYADIIILTAEDPRSESVGDIINQIKAGIKGPVKQYIVPDRYNAIKKAISIAKKGDTVAVLGKGHEKSMNMDGLTEIPWSDSTALKKALKNYES